MCHVILFVLFDVLVVGGLCCVVIFAFVLVFDCIGFIIVHIRLGFSSLSWSSWPPLVCDFLIGSVICVWYAMVGTSYSHLAIMAPKARVARKARKAGKARKARTARKAKKAGGKKRASKKKSGKKK